MKRIIRLSLMVISVLSLGLASLITGSGGSGCPDFMKLRRDLGKGTHPIGYDGNPVGANAPEKDIAGFWLMVQTDAEAATAAKAFGLSARTVSALYDDLSRLGVHMTAPDEPPLEIRVNRDDPYLCPPPAPPGFDFGNLTSPSMATRADFPWNIVLEGVVIVALAIVLLVGGVLVFRRTSQTA